MDIQAQEMGFPDYAWDWIDNESFYILHADADESIVNLMDTIRGFEQLNALLMSGLPEPHHDDTEDEYGFVWFVAKALLLCDMEDQDIKFDPMFADAQKATVGDLLLKLAKTDCPINVKSPLTGAYSFRFVRPKSSDRSADD